jgi:FlaA1/EpsC-like NDP-sugar epimerase
MKRFNIRLWVVAHDLAMVGLAWLFTFYIRIGTLAPSGLWTAFLYSLPFVVTIQGIILWRLGLYKGLWRFASLHDLWNIARAALLGALVVMVALFIVNRGAGIPRSAALFYPVFLTFFLGGPRLLYRVWKDYGLGLQKAIPGAKRVLVLGAGHSGEMLVREMRRKGEYQPIGFLDDDRRLWGAKVHGLPVFGPMQKLPAILNEEEIDIAVIAMPSATNAQMRRIVDLCEASKIPFRTLPRLQDLVSGRASLRELREVAIEDLLGRDPVQLDWKKISDQMAGKVVLVTGGGGSIGSELCRQVARLGPSRLVVLDRSEFNLFSIELELKRDFPNLTLEITLADICDEVAVGHVFEEYSPDLVFHAAAYKHVPMLEGQVREAVRNNVLGTRTIALAADSYETGIFVLVSSDKAVNPANVMGATKRAAEIFCQSLGQSSATRFITVRFGNVLGSAGSVVPLFNAQIEAGGPVTVTHPDISRYFMTISEASQLIIQSGVMGNGGEIFVLDMGEPIKIAYLAEEMIRLSGKTPGVDIKIAYTGLRPGEKLFEELFHDQENLAETDHTKILLAQSRAFEFKEVDDHTQGMVTYCQNCDNDTLKLLLKKLVPEMGATGLIDEESNVIPFEKVSN